MKNKYVTERERYCIETLYREGFSVKGIADRLERCKATIYNELKRGMVTLLDSEFREYTTYDAYKAHEDYLLKSKEKGRPLKIGNDWNFVHYIEEKIKHEKYSPCAVLACIRNSCYHYDTNVCFKTLYNYIHSGVFLNLNNSDLPYNKKGKKPSVRRSSVDLKNLKGLSIEERPQEIKDREIYGHWEMDTVYSGKDKSTACLLVLTERKTRQEIIRKMPDRTNISVKNVLDDLEKEYGFKCFRETFLSITCDNGVEFLNYHLLENSCLFHCPRTTLFYCHPYCSSERGSNENANKLIRRFIPKGSDISQYSDEFISYIEYWINHYPRSIFDYHSSDDMLPELVA